MAEPCLWIVVPCFNEGGGALLLTAPRFIGELQSLVEAGRISASSRICYVDDGSTDSTWEEVKQLSASESCVVGIRLSRNRGHQNALFAGLMAARHHCDVSISMDCDGQDDFAAIEKMLAAYQDGFDIVYGVRADRSVDSPFKRTTAELFYKILRRLGAESVYNHADFRLLSSRALDALSLFPEVNLYLRGLVPLIGFPSTAVAYERGRRVAGETHYPLAKMISLAMNGITNSSTIPLRLVSGLGFIVSVISLVGIAWAIIAAIAGTAVGGWASLMCVLGLVSGVQLLCLGVVGEYVGRIYLESKRRPRFIISETTGSDGEGVVAL